MVPDSLLMTQWQYRYNHPNKHKVEFDYSSCRERAAFTLLTFGPPTVFNEERNYSEVRGEILPSLPLPVSIHNHKVLLLMDDVLIQHKSRSAVKLDRKCRSQICFVARRRLQQQHQLVSNSCQTQIKLGTSCTDLHC